VLRTKPEAWIFGLILHSTAYLYRFGYAGERRPEKQPEELKVPFSMQFQDMQA
jgi:hypothetical protein